MMAISFAPDALVQGKKSSIGQCDGTDIFFQVERRFSWCPGKTQGFTFPQMACKSYWT